MFGKLYSGIAIACSLFCSSLFADNTKVPWDRLPQHVQDAGKAAMNSEYLSRFGKMDNDGEIANFRSTIGGGKIVDVDALGGVLGELFGKSGHRAKDAQQRRYVDGDDMDIFFVPKCRKIYLTKESDNEHDRSHGRVRIIILHAGKKADENDEEQTPGYALVHHQQIVGPGEKLSRVKENGDWGDFIVIMYPLDASRRKPNNLYYHFESQF